MECGMDERGVRPEDIVKVVAVDVLMLVSLVGNATLYRSVTKRTEKIAPHHIVLRFILAFGAVFAGFSALSYTVSTFSGKVLKSYAMCQVYGLLTYVMSSGWIWLLTIAALERYTRCVKTAEYTTWFSSINVKIMLWGTVLLLGVIFFAPVYGWGQYSVWRGRMTMVLGYNDSVLQGQPVGQQDTVVILLTYVSNSTNFDQTLTSTSRELGQWLTGYDIEIGVIALQQQGFYLTLHAHGRSGVECLWRRYSSGELGHEISHTLSGVYPPWLIQNLTYRVSLDQVEVQLYKNVHLFTQESSTCGIDFTLTRRDAYAFTFFMLTIVLAIPLSVILVCHIRIVYRSRKPIHATEERAELEDYSLAKIYFLAALTTIILFLFYFLLDIVSAAGHYIPKGVHFFRHFAYYSSSLTLWVSHVLIVKSPYWYEKIHQRFRKRKVPVAASRFPEELQNTQVLNTNGEDEANLAHEELIVSRRGPSASSTETQMTNL